ncbi:MAG: Ger(x)C family spore germination C-terminal domain-containing protein [Oscillospiraceae bacterium]|jgi:spore germination protein KC|nr:Ger(x)C family spore germination C-terminal domain-containing protein [Oscillospiraceae bacterium]
MIKKAIAPVIAVVAALLFACGATLRFFPHMSEISDFEVVQVIGIDKKGDGVEVTLMADRESPPGGGGETPGGTGMTGIMSFEGRTVFEAISRMNIYSDKRRHLGYVDYLLIDENAARDDITKYIDFFTREYEVRYSMVVFITRGVTAKELLRTTATANRRMADVLTNIDESIKELSNSRMLRLIDLLRMLSDGNEAAVIPAVTYEDTDFAKVIGAEKPEKTAVPDGFAFIRDGRLAGFYDDGLAQAYNGLTGRAHAVPISVMAEDGEYAALELLQYRIDFDAFWDGKTLTGARYDVTVEANLTEQFGRGNVFTERGLKTLEDGAAALIERDMRAVAAKSARLGRDGFELGQRVRMKNPVKWAGIADEWSELFPKVDVEIDVKCVISRSYDLRERAGEHG